VRAVPRLIYDARMDRPGDRGSDGAGAPPGDAAGGEASDADATEPVATVMGAAGDPQLTPGSDLVAGGASLPPSGYQLGAVIGQGGMGEVIVGYDRRIGREVAVKRMRSAGPSEEATLRFLREARIQARLDHPAIVPVHELGVDETGRPYFTMKRLWGRTLAQHLAEGAPLSRLLRAFVDVCLAIELAHARAVVHRDLKPSNIMLGDYGEVYVLDWGVARLLGEPVTAASQPSGDRPAAPGTGALSPIADPDDSGSTATRTGAVLGTPGYAAPEQLEGDAASTPADVYALGAILFEILAGEPLHPKGHHRAIASTLASPHDAPTRRRPERGIAPELDAICAQSLAADPTARPTAHQLAHAVQAYLDGDRDVERRRALASEQLRAAHDALASGAPDARATALRRAGRALALDPERADAAALVSSLLLEPPSVDTSPALAASLDAHERTIASDRSRKAIVAYLSVFALAPMVIVLDVKSWWIVIATAVTLLLGAAASWRHAAVGRPSVPVSLAVTLALAILFSRIASPFVLTPLLVCAALAGLTSIPAIAERRWLAMGWTVTAVMLPMALEWLGVLARTWEVSAPSVTVVGELFHTRGRGEEIALVIANLLFTVMVSWLALEISRRRLAAQRQVFAQAWHLGQLVPGAPAHAVAAAAPSSGIRGPGTSAAAPR
jgi:serine/threonine-protein kinase